VRSLHSAAVALLLITDVEAAARPPAQLLCALFGLTSTEAQLAVHLCTGETLRRSADALSITEGYARQRLKAIFQKNDHDASRRIDAIAR
jgi:DNA-binding CsgD family transcriptional regulator